MTVPTQISLCAAQHTLLTTHHSTPIILDSLDNSPYFSDSSVPSLDSSIPGESASDTESSLSDSNGRGQSCPGSPDVGFLGNAEDDGSEEEIISLLGFSKSDTKEVRAAAAH